MTELRKVMLVLGILQDLEYAVVLVTDWRLSGASGKAPAAIHVTPEPVQGAVLVSFRTVT